MLEDPKILDLLEYVFHNNATLVKYMMAYKASLEDQVKAALLSPAKANRNRTKTILVPRGNTFEFCLTNTDDVHPDEPSHVPFVLVKTAWDVLPIILEHLPKPISVLDIDTLWSNHMQGKKIQDDEVFYLIKPDYTGLVQRVNWEFVGRFPVITGLKAVTLYDARTDDVYFHELLMSDDKTLE